MPAKLDNVDLKLRRAIALRLKNLRYSLGRTQKDIALETGRDKQSYSKNERGKGTTIYTISKFCAENGISLSDFFNSDEFSYLKIKKK
jgi:transcriptional regulator with XRE-family HTH domain